MSDCGCSPRGGGLGLGTTFAENSPRPLTSAELASFYSRHPGVLARAQFTEAMLATGQYDFTPGSWVFDEAIVAIPPWGLAVQDPYFDWVVLMPTHGGVVLVNGFQPAAIASQINDAPYISPEGEVDTCQVWRDTIGLDVCGWVWMGAGLAVLFLVLSARRK